MSNTAPRNYPYRDQAICSTPRNYRGPIYACGLLDF